MLRSLVRTSALLMGMLSICFSQSSCRSELYRAAERGDTETVELLIKQRKMYTWANGPQNIFLFPMCVGAVVIDTTTVLLAGITFGGYYHCLYTDRPYLIQRFLKTPRDAALDAGQYETAELLRRNGMRTVYSKHYHGRYNSAPHSRN